MFPIEKNNIKGFINYDTLLLKYSGFFPPHHSILVIEGHYLFGVEMEQVKAWFVIFSP